MSKKSKKASAMGKSQEPFDYREIQELREKAWNDPQVQKNWEEFHKRQEERKTRYIRNRVNMSEKSKTSDKRSSNGHYDYSRIERLRQDAWNDPQVQKNWEEFHKRQEERENSKK